MGSGSIWSVIFIACVFSFFQPSGYAGMLNSAKTVEEIKQWATSEFLSARTEEYKFGYKQLCVVFSSITSGVHSTEIFVYSKSSEDGWKLFLWRGMVMEQVTASQSEASVNFKTEGGRLLFSLPLEGID